ncbi:MAG TPA: uroporphyrinogen-III C-methyltransferase [Planctomycetota bacterium]|nr:uroporphyrinogen-III C-methyltransferase [Planctomycetota bacterium]
MKKLYPLYLKLSGKPVLVVGGGPVALRRTERLLETGARVTVVSPTLVRGLEALRDAERIEWRARKLSPGDAAGMALVFVAAGDPAARNIAREETRERGILLSCADEEEHSDFHVPAVASRGPIQLAVSTGGESPGTASFLRESLERWLAGNDEPIRAALLEPRGARPGARRDTTAGKVYLVGAGPGDPGLLTLRAVEVLEAADVVYHDRLVSDAVLARVPRRAERVYVGKEVGCTVRADIPALLIESARRGKTVVRLKGGDPLVFGRGAEEMAALVQAGVDFELVPGVSALNAVPGSAGIPLTCRGVSSEIVVRSGHCRDETESGGGGGAVGERGTTYVYFMARSRLADVASALLQEGLLPSTPAALIENGTLPHERTIVGELGTIVEAAERERVETPVLLIVGSVVRLREARQTTAGVEASRHETSLHEDSHQGERDS